MAQRKQQYFCVLDPCYDIGSVLQLQGDLMQSVKINLVLMVRKNAINFNLIMYYNYHHQLASVSSAFTINTIFHVSDLLIKYLIE